MKDSGKVAMAPMATGPGTRRRHGVTGYPAPFGPKVRNRSTARAGGVNPLLVMRWSPAASRAAQLAGVRTGSPCQADDDEDPGSGAQERGEIGLLAGRRRGRRYRRGAVASCRIAVISSTWS